VDLARARLAAQVPSLAVPPAAPAIPTPDLDTGRLDEMGRQVVERSHDIAAADAEALRLAALARRAKADRIADPHIGLRLFQERNGAERGAGVVMSIPLGIAARRATADQAAAEASAATAERAAMRASVTELATTNIADLRAKLNAWQFAQTAAQGQQTALARLKRGQALGAIDLADVLQAERLAHAAARIEARARAEAHRAWAKMLIDSHNLWIGD
jgi:outer membrane protein TolC